MKIFGCPNGPPPPSQATIRSCVHRTGCLWIKVIAASGAGCNSIIVCSNLGPDIAFALGFWLLDQIADLFGACVTLKLSACSTLSEILASLCGVSIGNSLLLLTFGTSFGASLTLISLFSLPEKAYPLFAVVEI